MSSNNFRKSISADKSDFDKTDFSSVFSLDKIKRKARRKEYEKAIRPLLNGNEKEIQNTRAVLEDTCKEIVHKWFVEKYDFIEYNLTRLVYSGKNKFTYTYSDMDFYLKNGLRGLEYYRFDIDRKFSFMLTHGIIQNFEFQPNSSIDHISIYSHRTPFFKLVLRDYLEEVFEGFQIVLTRSGFENRW